MAYSLPFPWDVFADLHPLADSRVLDGSAWGVDEAVDAILDEIETRTLSSSPNDARQRFKNLCSNRRTKHRHRLRILRKRYAHHIPVEHVPEPSEAASRKEELKHIHQRTTFEEWRLLEQIATGYTYHEIAEHTGLTIQNLKSKVSRLRARLVPRLP